MDSGLNGFKGRAQEGGLLWGNQAECWCFRQDKFPGVNLLGLKQNLYPCNLFI